MVPWIVRLLEATFPVVRWLDRLYGLFLGLFLLALGTLFFYWSGRGLLAYSSGIRTAWSDPLAGVAGLAAAILSLWAGVRLVRHGIPPLPFGRPRGMSAELEAALEEATRLEKTDPAAAGHLLDNYFMREAAATETRRAALRRRAVDDITAALDLRRELQDEVRMNALARKDLLASLPDDRRAPLLTQIDEADQQLQSELLQLEGTIERLGRQ